VLIVPGENTTTATLSGLTHSSNFSIQLAAFNSVGVGVYGPPVTVSTAAGIFLTLNGTVISNDGYVLISDVGSNNATALVCNTNLPPGREHSSGEWVSPDGTLVGGHGSGQVPGFVMTRGPMETQLLRNMATDPPSQGMYHCQIEDSLGTLHSLYVGLYNAGEGNTSVRENISFVLESDENGASLSFMLTCISTGGPATTVTWTRDSVPVTEGTESMLDDPVSAQYTHTLNVTGRQRGLYTCAVSNNVSVASQSLTVQAASAPTNLTALQKGLTSVQVSWTPPSPLGDTLGYRINHVSNSSASMEIADGSTDTILLTQLQNRASYSISIIATSKHLSSGEIGTTITLVPLPGKPRVSVTSITATTVSLFWSVPRGSVVNHSVVEWQESDSNSTFTSSIVSDFAYTIRGLRNSTVYSVVVTVINAAGSVASQIAVSTSEEVVTSVQGGFDKVRLLIVISGAVIGTLVLTICLALTVLVIVVRQLRRHKVHHATPVPTSPVRISAHEKDQELVILPDEPFYAAPTTVISTKTNVAYRSSEQLIAADDGYDTITVTPRSV
jgi:hypothetical protein